MRNLALLFLAVLAATIEHLWPAPRAAATDVVKVVEVVENAKEQGLYHGVRFLAKRVVEKKRVVDD